MRQQAGASSVIAGLGDLVDDLEFTHSRTATAWAAEMQVLAQIPGLILRRERDDAARTKTESRQVASTTQLAQREIYAEVAAALNLSEHQVGRRVEQAYRLVHDFPETLFDVRAGMLSPQHAQAIIATGSNIENTDTRVEYERYALEIARELTPAQLASTLEVLVDRLDPDGTQDRIRRAKTERGVRKRGLAHGMSQVIITAPTAEVEGAFTRLGDIASEIHADNRADAAEHAAARGAAEAPPTAGAASGDRKDDGFTADERTKQQIMADLALDLLLTGAPEGHGATEERRAQLGVIRATVHITIPAATLAGTGTGGAIVIGAGQIDDAAARRLAGDSDIWYRYFIDPTTGVPVSVDRRRPCTAQKRLLRARDEHCRFPGCRRPARKSDIDHTIAASDGGPTALWNLAHLCERHHTLKHHTDWSVEQLPGGVLRFTAPTGRHHITRPPGAVRFVPDRPPGSPSARTSPLSPSRAREHDPAPF